MTDILKRVEELSDLFDNKGSERLEFNLGGRIELRKGTPSALPRQGVNKELRELYNNDKLTSKIIELVKKEPDNYDSILKKIKIIIKQLNHTHMV